MTNGRSGSFVLVGDCRWREIAPFSKLISPLTLAQFWSLKIRGSVNFRQFWCIKRRFLKLQICDRAVVSFPAPRKKGSATFRPKFSANIQPSVSSNFRFPLPFAILNFSDRTRRYENILASAADSYWAMILFLSLDFSVCIKEEKETSWNSRIVKLLVVSVVMFLGLGISPTVFFSY